MIEAKHCSRYFWLLDPNTFGNLTVHQTPNLLCEEVLLIDTDNWMSNQMSDPNTNCWLPIGNARFLVYLWGSISKGNRMDAHKHLTEYSCRTRTTWSIYTEITKSNATLSFELVETYYVCWGRQDHLKYICPQVTFTIYRVVTLHLCQEDRMVIYDPFKLLCFESPTENMKNPTYSFIVSWFHRIKPPSKEVLHQECSRRIRWNWSHS